MKKFAAYILILLPSLVFGQLFPKVPDLKGNIARVTEKRYGIEVSSSKGDSGVFKPGKYSGWKYTYLFDENSKLSERLIEFQDEPNTEYLYQRDTIGNSIIERETIRYNIQGKMGDYVEYENVTDSMGRVKSVNFWSFDARENLRELFLVEMYTEYDHDKLTSFTRYSIKDNGDIGNREKCSIFYDSSGKIIRIERKDIELNLKTIIYYFYNSEGLIEFYSIDYLKGLRNDQNKQKQDIWFKYDRNGNWVRRYYIVDGKKKLEARRSIKYY